MYRTSRAAKIKKDHICCCAAAAAMYTAVTMEPSRYTAFQDSKTRKRNKIYEYPLRTRIKISHLVVLDGEEHEAPGVLDEHRLGLEAPVHLSPSHVRDLHATLELVLLALRRLQRIGWEGKKVQNKFRGRFTRGTR